MLPDPAPPLTCYEQQLLVGELTDDRMEAEQAYLRHCPPPKSLIVSSIGGESRVGVYFGRLIRDNNITLIIRGICGSSCAQFMFLPARTVVLERSSLVLFHNTSNSILSAFLTAEPGAKLDWPRLRASAKVERDAYAEWGIDRRWLYAPLARLEPVCFYTGEDRRSPPSPLPAPYYKSRYIGWIPDRSAFPDKDIAGTWPTAKEIPIIVHERQLPEAYVEWILTSGGLDGSGVVNARSCGEPR